MSKRVAPTKLGDALGEVLTLYAQDVADGVDAVGEETMVKLVEETKRTAPIDSGAFRRAISSQCIKRLTGNVFVWYAKGRQGRLTHLLVHGHAKRNGGRVPGNPFLANALKHLLPEYEKLIKGVVERD